MKNLLSILLIFAIFISCSKDENTDDGRIKPTTENIIGSWANTNATELNYYQFIDSKNGLYGNYNNGTWFLRSKFTYTLTSYKINIILTDIMGGYNGSFYFLDSNLYIGNVKYERVQVNKSED